MSLERVVMKNKEVIIIIKYRVINILIIYFFYVKFLRK